MSRVLGIGECDCDCHTSDGVIHMIPCCSGNGNIFDLDDDFPGGRIDESDDTSEDDL